MYSIRCPILFRTFSGIIGAEGRGKAPIIHRSIHSSTVELDVGGKEIRVPTIWLRHHCRCNKCFNNVTHQRILIPAELETKDCNVRKVSSEGTEKTSLQITWNDGHISTYDFHWLQDQCKSGRARLAEDKTDDRSVLKVPGRPSLSEISGASVRYEDFMATTEGLAKALANIKNFGLTLITDSPANKPSTDKAIARISHPMNTLYGDFWEFESNLAFADTAYTSAYVHLHTDTTYFTEPAGLQVFHCLKHDGEGGLNSLVDGFEVARELQHTNPEYYKTLCQTLLPWQYIDPGKEHFHTVAPIFQHNLYTGELECIRYNPHDLAEVNTIPEDRIIKFYESLIQLSKMIEVRAKWFKLMPGSILIFDNWRMFHGRNEFTGSRKLCGAYISRSDWMSRAKVLLNSDDKFVNEIA